MLCEQRFHNRIQWYHTKLCFNINLAMWQTWQTSLLFLELLQIQNLKRKNRGTWHIISPHLKKWGTCSPCPPPNCAHAYITAARVNLRFAHIPCYRHAKQVQAVKISENHELKNRKPHENNNQLKNRKVSIVLRQVGLQQLLHYDVTTNCCEPLRQTLAMW